MKEDVGLLLSPSIVVLFEFKPVWSVRDASHFLPAFLYSESSTDGDVS